MVEKKSTFTKAKEKAQAYNKYIEQKWLDKKFPHGNTLNEIKRIGLITAAATVMLSSLVAMGKKTTSSEEAFDAEQKYHMTSIYKGMSIEDVRKNKKGLQMNEFLFILGSCAVLAIYLNANDKKELKQSKEAVDLMLDLKNRAKRYDIDIKRLDKLTRIVPDVFANMAADTRAYFDLLCRGDFPLNDNGRSLQLATVLMAEHLSKHPEDYELLLSAFDEESSDEDAVKELLPEDIVKKYGKKKSR